MILIGARCIAAGFFYIDDRRLKKWIVDGAGNRRRRRGIIFVLHRADGAGARASVPWWPVLQTLNTEHGILLLYLL